MQLRCARGEDGGGDDYARDAYKFAHHVCGEFAELKHVESGANGDLNAGYGLLHNLVLLLVRLLHEGEEY